MKMKNPAVLIVLMVAAVFFVILFYAQTEYKNQKVNLTTVYSDNGIFDLTDFDFSTSIAYLNGNIEYIEGEVLTPEEFKEKENLIIIGNPVDYNTARTARATLIMPDDGVYIMNTLCDYARTFYVNGDHYLSVGTVADNEEDFVPGYKRISLQAKAENNVLEYIIQGGNFVHREGSSYSIMYIGSPELLSWYLNFDTSVEILSAGMFLALALLYFILAFVTKNYRINIYFSLLSIIWFLRLGVTGSKFFYMIIDDLPWIVAFKIEYLSLAFTVALLAEILYYHLNEVTSLKALKIATYTHIVFAIFFLLLDSVTMSKLVLVSTTAFIVTIVYVSIIACSLLFSPEKRKKIDFPKRMVIISMLILFVSAIHDGLFYANFQIMLNTLTESGILVFAVLEAIGIFYINVKTLEDARFKEEKRRLEALELERFLKMKSNFIGIVAHEIKTPLAIIMGYAGDTVDILEDDGDTKEIKDNQQIIIDTVKEVNDTVFELLDTVALETGRLSIKKENVNLKRLIMETTEQFKLQIREGENELRLDINEPMQDIIADGNRIRQVLHNVLSNACHHTNNASITIKLWGEKDYNCISISDEGKGIAPVILEKLKSSYVDGGPHGYRGGIGIYICNEIIRAHLGLFEIESYENEGTTVTIKLPKIYIDIATEEKEKI